MEYRREHEPGAPPERGRGPEEHPRPETDKHEALLAAERRVRDEVEAERRNDKERIADSLWEQPARFVERVIAKGPTTELGRFLEHFGSLEDEAAATEKLRRAREAARRAGQG